MPDAGCSGSGIYDASAKIFGRRRQRSTSANPEVAGNFTTDISPSAVMSGDLCYATRCRGWERA